MMRCWVRLPEKPSRDWMRSLELDGNQITRGKMEFFCINNDTQLQ